MLSAAFLVVCLPPVVMRLFVFLQVRIIKFSRNNRCHQKCYFFTKLVVTLAQTAHYQSNSENDNCTTALTLSHACLTLELENVNSSCFTCRNNKDAAFKMGLDISDIMDYTSTLIELSIRKGSFLSGCHQMMELLEEAAFGYVTKYLRHGGC